MRPLWTKLRHDIHTDPKIGRIAAHIAPKLGRYAFAAPAEDLLGTCPQLSNAVVRDVTIAALHRVWSGVSRHHETRSETCCIPQCNVTYIDSLAGIEGFGNAMASIGWLIFDPKEQTITIPNWSDFNGTRRATDGQNHAKSSTERVREFRARQQTGNGNGNAEKRVSSVDETPENVQIEDRRSTSTTTTTRPRIDDVLSYAEGQRKGDATGKPITEEIARAWHDDRTAAGWQERRQGHEYDIRDWKADLRKYARHWWDNKQALPLNFAAAPSSAHSTPPPTLTTKPKAGW